MKRSLTREERLKRKTDFDSVFSSGRRKGCSGARLVYRRNELEYSRFAVCPVRKYGNAVERNRVKRICRELFRGMKDRIRPGFDIVLVVYPGKDTYKVREEQFSFLLREGNLFPIDTN
jgi:ribonuclease P protein component